MPEVAEVRISGNFANLVGAGENKIFNSIQISPLSKVKTDFSEYNQSQFGIDVLMRGKETLVRIERFDPGTFGYVKNLSISMGMSGHWVYYDPKDPQSAQTHIHTHLRFIEQTGNILGIMDVRRFAKWKFVDGFSKNRGACPLSDFANFRSQLLSMYGTPSWKKPIYEVLMDQFLFNGVGNYLRAEILARVSFNPLSIGSSLTIEQISELADITGDCVRWAYVHGGGQLKDWKNPMGIDPGGFDAWRIAYQNKNATTLIDSNGRRFWYLPQYAVDLQLESNLSDKLAAE